MSGLLNSKTGLFARARRLFSFLWSDSGNSAPRSEWETQFMCSEAPLCAELLRREHHHTD